MSSAVHDDLLGELPALQRLALAYAPAAVREATLALFLLDTRLAAILRAAREPMLAQLRLAWWREQLNTAPATWPRGEPLLAVLRSWSAQRGALVGLVDGWEAMTGDAPLPASAFQRLAEARGEAFSALADLAGVSGDRDSAARLGANWALADLAAHLGHPEERAAALAMAEARDWRGAVMSRMLRPLVVLHGLAARELRRGAGHGGFALLTALRLGLLGR